MNKEEIVYVKDKENLNRKLKKIEEDGVKELHVVSDFDKTFNKEFLDVGKYKSAISLIRDGGYLENDYPKRANNLYNKYHPIEIDQSISFEDKKEKMKEWWDEHTKLLSECKMNKEVINDLLLKDTMKLREGVDVFLKVCFENNIPILIFSSGLGDIISGFLNKKNILFPNIHIISNFFDWDENGFAKPNYKDKTIHLLNKNEEVIKNDKYYNKIKDKKNVIVIGDSLTDVNMVLKDDYECVLSIGFLNEKIDERLESYMQKFDVVITGDGSFKPVIEILNKIL